MFMSTCAQMLFVTVTFLSLGLSIAQVVTIPLSKQYVPLKRGDQVVAHKTAYFGTIFVGLPQHQEFNVVFDTGSAHVFLPSTACTSQTCLEHRRFDRHASASAVDIDDSGATVPPGSEERDQVSIAFGTGEVLGEFVKEIVCLASHSGEISAHESLASDCASVRVITASEMSQEPFRSFSFDGVIGLGLESLAVDPEFSFFGQAVKAGNMKEPRFGFFLSQSDASPSEITFGGHDERRVAAPLHWTPVAYPELGYWQVKIKSVKVGGVAIPQCSAGNCVGVVDSGTSLLGAPPAVVRDLHKKLARKVPEEPRSLDCRDVGGPDVIIDLGDFEISLGPSDYSRPRAMRVHSDSTGKSQVICRASLLPVDMGSHEPGGPDLQTWIFGEPMLRKYYTAFDWHRREIGFALAKQPAPQTFSFRGTMAHTVGTVPSAEPLTPEDVHV